MGLHFQLERGWHVYWINPGDSGEPPKVDWQLPAGYRADPLQFPFPRRMALQTLMNFGYEDDVLFPARLHVPATAKAGDIAKLTASIQWMVCKDVCIPGKGTLSFSLPVRWEAPKPSEHKEGFAKTLQQMPRKLPQGWRAQVSSSGDSFVLRLSNLPVNGKPAKTAEFFPFEELVMENAAPQLLTVKPGVLELRLKKAEQMTKFPARLKGVMVMNGARAYHMDLAVSTPLKK